MDHSDSKTGAGTVADSAAPVDMQPGQDIAALLTQGFSLGDLMGQSEESREAVYYLGYTFYNQGRYEDALRLFGYLLMSDHLDKRHYSGFAACMQMLRRHEEALKYHGIASMLDLTDPEPVIHSAECLVALGRPADARVGLEHALDMARGIERHAHHLPRVQAMLELLAAAAGPGDSPATPPSD